MSYQYPPILLVSFICRLSFGKSVAASSFLRHSSLSASLSSFFRRCSSSNPDFHWLMFVNLIPHCLSWLRGGTLIFISCSHDAPSSLSFILLRTCIFIATYFVQSALSLTFQQMLHTLPWLSCLYLSKLPALWLCSVFYSACLMQPWNLSSFFSVSVLWLSPLTSELPPSSCPTFPSVFIVPWIIGILIHHLPSWETLILSTCKL